MVHGCPNLANARRPDGGGRKTIRVKLSTMAYIAWAVFGGRLGRSLQAYATRQFLLQHEPAAIVTILMWWRLSPMHCWR